MSESSIGENETQKFKFCFIRTIEKTERKKSSYFVRVIQDWLGRVCFTSASQSAVEFNDIISSQKNENVISQNLENEFKSNNFQIFW